MLCTKIGYIDIDSVIDDYFNYKYMVLNPPENAYRVEQPIIPEVWLEKDAVAPSIQNWTSGLCTTIYFSYFKIAFWLFSLPFVTPLPYQAKNKMVPLVLLPLANHLIALVSQV